MNWQDYIDSFLKPVKDRTDLNISLMPVSPILRADGFLLSKLDFESGERIFYLNGSIFSILHSRGKKFAIVYLSNEKSSIPYSNRLKVDEFFFFLTKKFNISISEEISEKEMLLLTGAVEEAGCYKLDFQKTCDLYGRLYVEEFVGDSSLYYECVDFITYECDEVITRFVVDNSLKIEYKAVNDISRLNEILLNIINKNSINKIGELNLRFSRGMSFFEVYNRFDFSKSKIFSLYGGGACFDFEDKLLGRRYFAISSNNFSKDDKNDLEELLERVDLSLDEYSDIHFCAFILNFSDYFSIKSEYLKSKEIFENQLSLDDENYKLMSFLDVKKLFEDFFIFSSDADFSIEDLLIDIAIKFENMRAPFVSDEMVSKVSTINFSNCLNKNVLMNIYYSLTTTHWKHSFLEAYRVVENFYYLHWMFEIKKELNLNHDYFDLAKICKSTLSWDYKDEMSINKLFSMIQVDEVDLSAFENFGFISGDFSNKKFNEKLSVCASKIYAIRNSNVHSGVFDDKSIVPNVKPEDWPKLTCFLYEVIGYFLSKYRLQ